jgi:hypothetical protein
MAWCTSARSVLLRDHADHPHGRARRTPRRDGARPRWRDGHEHLQARWLQAAARAELAAVELESLPALTALEAGKCIKLKKAIFGDLPVLATRHLPPGVVVGAPRPAKKKA